MHITPRYKRYIVDIASQQYQLGLPDPLSETKGGATIELVTPHERKEVTIMWQGPQDDDDVLVSSSLLLFTLKLTYFCIFFIPKVMQVHVPQRKSLKDQEDGWNDPWGPHCVTKN